MWLVVVTMRLFRGITNDRDGLDLMAFRGLTAAGLPVGRCGCGGRAYGVDARRVAGGRRWWLTVRCDGCDRETATYIDRPAPARAA